MLTQRQVQSWRETLPQCADLSVRLNAADHTYARVRSLSTVELATRMGNRETQGAVIAARLTRHEGTVLSWKDYVYAEAQRTIWECVTAMNARDWRPSS